MSKLIMLRGLPASGKSTRAKEIIEKNGNFVRLNRDSLRAMLHFNRFSGRNEGITKKVQRAMAKELLLNDVNVIIDDTNLSEGHRQSWENLCKETNAKFTIENLSKKIDLKELFDRDDERKNHVEVHNIKAQTDASVGRHVIISLAMQNDLIGSKNFGDGTKKWIVCDIDGTIANLEHRLHFVKDINYNTDECHSQTCDIAVNHGHRKDWKSFFDEMSKDTVIENVRDMIIKYKEEGYPIIFVSGRPDSHRKQTKEWLENVAFKDIKFVEGEDYATILMRRSIDHRLDTEVKENILKHYLKPENVHLVIDDRKRVIEMWKRNNLTVVDVGTGEDF